MQIRDQRALFGDVLRGYSNFRNDLIVKHLDYFVLAEIDSLYSTFYNDAVSKGVPTEEDKLKYLAENGLWTQDNEGELKNHIEMIRGLENTKKTLYLEAQVKQFNQNIAREQSIYSVKINKKLKLLGNTAEKLASEKISAEYIYYSIYKDNARFYDRDTFDNLSNEEFNLLNEDYAKIINRFNTDNLMKLAIADFVQNLFSLCDGIKDFYGKPVTLLSVIQEQFIRYINFFSGILKEGEISEEQRNNPQNIVDNYISGKNLKNLAERTSAKGGNSFIVGASNNDLKNVDLGNNQIGSLVSKARREGKKSLNFSEIIASQK